MYGETVTAVFVASKNIGEVTLAADKHGNPFVKLGGFVRYGKDKTVPRTLFISGAEDKELPKKIVEQIQKGTLRKYAQFVLTNVRADFSTAIGKPQTNGAGQEFAPVYHNGTYYVTRWNDFAISAWGVKPETNGSSPTASEDALAAELEEEIPF